MELENPFLPGTAFKDLHKGDPLPDAPDFLAIRSKNLLAFVPQLLNKNLQGLDAVVDNEKQLEMVGRLRQLEHLCLSLLKTQIDGRSVTSQKLAEHIERFAELKVAEK